VDFVTLYDEFLNEGGGVSHAIHDKKQATRAIPNRKHGDTFRTDCASRSVQCQVAGVRWWCTISALARLTQCMAS
jgi:hypothetical protein